MMLLQATLIVDLIALVTTLWMAFYLFARGFPNGMTMRMVVVLLALSCFFFGAYNNIFTQIPGTAGIRAALLVIGLGGWYSLTYRIMSESSQKRFRWMEWDKSSLLGYPGTSWKPQMKVMDNLIFVAWSDKYCRGGRHGQRHHRVSGR